MSICMYLYVFTSRFSQYFVPELSGGPLMAPAYNSLGLVIHIMLYLLKKKYVYYSSETVHYAANLLSSSSIK